MLDGVFSLYESRGVPLDIILDKLREENYVVDWISFYKEARYRAFWNIDTILNKIELALNDVYGKEYSDEVIKRLKFYIMNYDYED